MRVGLIPAAGGAVGSAGAYVAEYVEAAESSGFDSVWVGEHPALPVEPEQAYPGSREGLAAPSSNPLPDPLEWLAFAAAHSTTLLLGTAVLILPLHHPVVLAKRLATLDQLAGGRLRLGIGVGWNRQEYVACGAAWEGRGAHAEETVAAMRVLWRDQQASFDGATIRFEPVYSSPKPPSGSVPILIGASLPVGARRAGRIGDGFLPFERDLDRLEQLVATMREAAADAGRDPADVEITALGGIRAERIERLARLGVARMLLFEADVDALPALGQRINDMIANAE